jgi:hypothetical protein
VTDSARPDRRRLQGALGALDQHTHNVERRLATLDSDIEAERTRRRIALAEQLADLRRRRADVAAQLKAIA